MTSTFTRLSTRKTSRTDNKNSVLTVEYISDDKVEKVINDVQVFSGQASRSKKVEQCALESESKRRKTRTKCKKDEINGFDGDVDNNVNEKFEKPTGQCDEDDVGGDVMYFFQTPRKKNSMLQKAEESAKKIKTSTGTPTNKQRTPLRKRTPAQATTPKQSTTPKQGRTPKRSTPAHGTTPTYAKTPARTSSSKRNITPSCRQTPRTGQKKYQYSSWISTPRKSEDVNVITVNKTPYHLRNRHKRDIQAFTRKHKAIDSSSEESEHSDDSDYEGSENSSNEASAASTASDDENSGSDSGKGSEVASSCRRSLRFQQPPTTPSSRKRGKDLNYVFTAEEYFKSKSSKCCTSNRSLSQLKTPRLDPGTLHSLLSDSSVSEAHKHILVERRTPDLSMFQQWMFALSQGYSVLAYGLGSKYKILQRFHQEMLSDSHVLVVNGFFPSLSIKEIVEMIAKELLGLKQVLPSPHGVIDWIESRRWMPRVFLIIHNIDAQGLRCEKTQLVLSRLASLPKVHLVTSVDHINSPLLWDQAKLSAFNFMWEDTTSFLPYQEETSYETSLMVKNSGSLALSSLLNVYRSLTHNSRGVFRIIMEKHLDENNPKYIGMPFSALYGRCREEMLVTSDLALRTMLTEFLDHQMVKWRRDMEHLYIPTDSNVLRQFNKLIQDS